MDELFAALFYASIAFLLFRYFRHLRAFRYILAIRAGEMTAVRRDITTISAIIIIDGVMLMPREHDMEYAFGYDGRR